MNRKIALILAALLIVFAVGFQVVGGHLNAGGGHVNIDALKQFGFSGWTKSEVPVGNTPEMMRAVENILAYDDVASWSLESGGRSFQLYAAYWKPGKMSSKEVAMHTPDNCWVAAGWLPVMSAEAAMAIDGVRLCPAQGRVFSISGVERAVIFWHIYGDRVISYGKAKPSFLDGIKDVVRDGLHLRREQLFIRISSNSKMSEVETWDAFRGLLKTLSEAVPSIRINENGEGVGE